MNIKPSKDLLTKLKNIIIFTRDVEKTASFYS